MRVSECDESDTPRTCSPVSNKCVQLKVGGSVSRRLSAYLYDDTYLHCVSSLRPSFEDRVFIMNSDGLEPAAFFSEHNALTSSLLDDLGMGLGHWCVPCLYAQWYGYALCYVPMELAEKSGGSAPSCTRRGAHCPHGFQHGKVEILDYVLPCEQTWYPVLARVHGTPIEEWCGGHNWNV